MLSTIQSHSSTARTASTNGATQTVPTTHQTGKLSVLVNVTAVSGTTPTLDHVLQWSNDGSTWVNDDTVTFPQFTANGQAARVTDVKGLRYRIVLTIGGTTPSFTSSTQEAIF